MLGGNPLADVSGCKTIADVSGCKTIAEVLGGNPLAEVLGGNPLADVLGVFVRTLNVVFTEFSFIFFNFLKISKFLNLTESSFSIVFSYNIKNIKKYII